MNTYQEYLQANKETWDKRTEVHVKSRFYDVNGFLNGNSSLNPIELRQLGDVSDKKLLHLQCHFGLDTLSWARLGAHVTGVDLSTNAILQARKLSKQANLPATFIESDLYQFGEENNQQYDVVFSSYGAICWLPDLTRWAQIIYQALKHGGEFHLIEFHPLNDLMSGYQYFSQAMPDIEEEGTYTENCDGVVSKTVCWSHSLADVISALLSAGLTLETFEESPYSPYQCFDNLVYVTNKGYQRLIEGQQVPLVYAIKAVRK